MRPAPHEPLLLRAGPLSMRFEAATGFLRHIRLGDREVLRGVYAAVRDRNWGTVPARIVLREVRQTADSFHLRFHAEARQEGIAFDWSGSLSGAPDGTLRYEMDGRARASFLRNRIGFCVLHPVRECAGQPCDLRHTDGSRERSRFPRDISPHQPFRDLRGIAHEVRPGLRAEVLLEGETFETEDQRNWTDASFKTYCTPLDLPFPVEVREGDVVRQSVTLSLVGDRPDEPPDVAAGPEASVRIGTEPVAALPAIGLGRAAAGLDPRDAALLRALGPAHLRVDLRPGQDLLPHRLRSAWTAAEAVGAPLEAALHLSDDAEGEIAVLRGLLDEVAPRVARWIVFHAAGASAASAWIPAVRRALGRHASGVPLGAGTDANFAELNRDRPSPGEPGFVCYSVNPQVHAFDDLSLVETLPVQGETVENARRFSSVEVVVTPVTLKPRFNAVATAAEAAPAEPGGLPPQFDPRQAGLFGAAWTLGSLAWLAAGGAASVTFFEDAGPLGVVAGAGPPGSGAPPSAAGTVFPAYHVLADAREFAGGRVLPSDSSDPLRAAALAIRSSGRVRVLLANLSGEPQTVRVLGPAAPRTARIRRLDAATLEAATGRPEHFRVDAWEALRADGPELSVEMGAHACACIDFTV